MHVFDSTNCYFNFLSIIYAYFLMLKFYFCMTIFLFWAKIKNQKKSSLKFIKANSFYAVYILYIICNIFKQNLWHLQIIITLFCTKNIDSLKSICIACKKILLTHSNANPISFFFIKYYKSNSNQIYLKTIKLFT